MTTTAIMLEMDDARRAKFKRLSAQIITLLKAECESPVEAYMLVRFIQDGFEQSYDIKGSIVYGKEDVGHA